MSDQCGNCTIRGDIKKCLETDCFQHEDWWAKTVLAQLAEAQKEAFPAYKREKALRCKAEAENAELKTEIERRNSKTWCAYCGFEIDIDDEASTKISEHIMSCPKHPIRIYERHSEALEAENAELKRKLEVAVKLDADTDEKFDWNVLGKVDDLEQENAELRERLKPVEYQKYEFCKDVECTALEYNACNAYVCYKTAKHFHKWLKQHGYKIVKVASIV